MQAAAQAFEDFIRGETRDPDKPAHIFQPEIDTKPCQRVDDPHGIPNQQRPWMGRARSNSLLGQWEHDTPIGCLNGA